MASCTMFVTQGTKRMLAINLKDEYPDSGASYKTGQFYPVLVVVIISLVSTSIIALTTSLPPHLRHYNTAGGGRGNGVGQVHQAGDVLMVQHNYATESIVHRISLCCTQ